MTEAAAEAGIQRGEEDGDGVVTWGLGQFLVGAVIEGDGLAGAALLGVVFGETVARSLLGGEGGEGEEGGGEEAEEPHGGKKSEWESNRRD